MSGAACPGSRYWRLRCWVWPPLHTAPWGLALAGALVIYQLLQRSRRGMVGALLAGLPFVAGYLLWTLRNEANGGMAARTASLPSTGCRLLPPLQRRARQQPAHPLAQRPAAVVCYPATTFTLNGHGLHGLTLLVGVGIVAVLAVGFVAQARRRLSLVEIFVLLHVGLVSIAPLNARYWLPILPFLILYFIVGVRTLLAALQRWLTPRQASAIVALALVTLAGLHIVRDVQNVVDPPRRRVPDVAIGPHRGSPPTRRAAPSCWPIRRRVSYLYARRTIGLSRQAR